ncbi:hypothetical protein ACUN9Y_07580 [Halomonas sp. V046]|uniref:hypothetical protein n=1 Tax=Halomonas sp. V046 TaxID=3459611 RepID=UPI004043AFC3
MPKVRHYADLVATLAGLMWLMLYWSISISLHIGTPEPALAALLALGSMILVSFAHRPVRVMLSRYHVRKRRTEMWMHILALPLTLAFLFAIVIDHLLTPMSGAQKMLLFNVLATASWLVFLVTLLVKLMVRNVQDRRGRDDDSGTDTDADTTTNTGITATSDEARLEASDEARLEASVASAPPPGHEDARQRADETPAADATDKPSDTTPPHR